MLPLGAIFKLKIHHNIFAAWAFLVWKIRWKRKVSGPVVYVRRELAIIWFCDIHGCKKWIHKRRSGVKGRLHNASQSFICRCCKVDSPITDGLNTDLHLDIGNGILLEKVDKFCYLGDVGCRWRVWFSSDSQSRICLEKVSWLEKDSR